MAITVETRTDIIELIVGMVGAAPGAAILSELAEIVDGGLSLNDLAIALANNPAFKVLYPSFLTNTEFATNFLTNLMGAEVDATTLSTSIDAMVADLNAGTHRGAAMYTAITTLSATAETDANFGAAAAALNNQTEVAVHYSVTTQQSAETLDELKAVVTGVTSSEATVTAAKATIDGTNAAGTEFTLTTGLNTVNGSTNNDTILGTVNATAASSTFSLGDIIDGKAGSDTLRLATDHTAIDTATATVKNVETLEISSSGALTTLDGDSDGYTAVSLDTAGAALAISGFASATALSIGNIKGAHAVTITYDAVTGSSDVANITIGTADTGSSLIAAGVETVNLNITGKAKIDAATTFANATTLNIANAATSTLNLATAGGTKGAVVVTGAGGLTLGTLNASYASIDASGSTSGVTATLDAAQTSVIGGAGTDKITAAVPTTKVNINTGAGNDTVTVAALDLTAAGAIDGTNEIIDGGEGTDTLSIDETDLTAALLKANVAKALNFEALTATGIITAFAANGFAINTFNFTADNTSTGARTYTIASDDTLNLSSSNGTNTMTLNPVLDSGTDVLNLGLNLTTANLTQLGIIASQIETINISSTDALPTTALGGVQDNIITALTVQNNTKINVTGNANTTFTTVTGTELTIDGSASTGKLTVTVVGGNDTITGGSAADTLDGAAGIDTINGGGGKDTITGGAGADILTGGDAVDTFVTPAADSDASTPDSITDFNTGGSDVLRFAAADNKADVQAALPVATLSVQVDAGGKASFAAADDTLSERVAALAADTNLTANEVVFFELGSDTYVYGSGAAGDATNDFMVKLTGVTGLTTITESTTTAGDFTLA